MSAASSAWRTSSGSTPSCAPARTSTPSSPSSASPSGSSGIRRVRRARPGDNPVMLPMVPVGFPVPSYASEAFLAEAARWFALVGPALAPLRYPEGPIVLCQIDNEGALYFRDGPYDQDYRPEAIALYRDISARKVRHRRGPRGAPTAGTSTRLRQDRCPPRCSTPRAPTTLAWHLDWVEFQEQLRGRRASCA